MIYLASPYSHPDSAIRRERYAAALLYCKRQMSVGQVIFSPIVYGHQFATAFSLPTDHNYWQGFNERVLIPCNQVHVLALPGHTESEGIRAERAFAEAYGISILVVQP